MYTELGFKAYTVSYNCFGAPRAGDCSLLDLGLSRPPRDLPLPRVALLGELLRESSETAGEPKILSRASAYLRSFSARSFWARALLLLAVLLLAVFVIGEIETCHVS
jgi:hypothetical protein